MDASQAAAPVLPDAEPDRRVAAMVANHHSQVWRSLRRLGLSESDADDASQQVFLVAHRRLADIVPENEQAFLLQTALRVAAEFRRTRQKATRGRRSPCPGGPGRQSRGSGRQGAGACHVGPCARGHAHGPAQGVRAVRPRRADHNRSRKRAPPPERHGGVAAPARARGLPKTVLRMSTPRSPQYGAGGKP
jgi:hypothetical protein